MSVDENAAAAIARLDVSTIAKRATNIVCSDAPREQKYFALTEIADDAAAKIAPSTPCRRGCAHCCHMAVAISDHEALLIEGYAGRSRTAQPKRDPSATKDHLSANVKRYSGARCTFLDEKNDCTVYPVRPMACRLHHSLEDTAEPCDIVTRPGTPVPTINVHALQGASVMVTVPGPFADIREFFPA